MKITVDARGLAALQVDLRDFSERRLNAALATALTRTALEVRDELRRSMSQVFDRPTPYTLRSLFVQPATGNRGSAGVVNLPGADAFSGRLARSRFLEAEVFLKDDPAGSGTPATQYLSPQIAGGGRGVKRLEANLRAAGHLPAGWFIVPGAGARLDAYGNLSRGQIIQMLSQLRITLLSGFTRNMSRGTTRARAAQRRAGGRFFVIPPGSTVMPGIYQREFLGRNITPVVVFVRSVTYRKRWDFYGISRRVALQRLEGQVQRAVGEQLARLSSRRGAS